MAILKCKMCGGELNLVEGASTAECEYCGSVQTVPKVDDEKKLNLFARANRLRAACDFDKAAGIYESIVADFPEEAEAYWGLVLCSYGIEYVDDPATGKKIHTCHRSDFNSVMKDPNVELAQEYADVTARCLYREEAKQIEELRKSIIAVSVNEEPYDIFICYKETDFDGKRTLDSVLAQDIYDALTDKNYRVFFSRISLEDKLGTEYEPYIFAALNSAKIMLVIGTDFEYFNAVWVKNEWSRFLKLMAQDKTKHLIPCYKGIDAYDMPEEFARLQAQDLDKMGAVQDIVHGVQKLLPRQKETTIIQERVVVDSSTGNKITAMLDRGNMALEDGDWAKADNFFEDVLNNDSKNAQAYLGKALALARCRSLDAFITKRKETLDRCDIETKYLPADTGHIEQKKSAFFVPDYVSRNAIGHLYDFDLHYASRVSARKKQVQDEETNWASHKLLSRAEKFATGAVAANLQQKKQELFAILKDRVKKAEQAEAAAIKDVQNRYAQHLQQADENAQQLYNDGLTKREKDYQQLKEKAENLTEIELLTETAQRLEKFGDYQDSKELVALCFRRIEELRDKQKEEERLRRQQELQAIARKKAKIKKIAILSGAAAILTVLSIVLINLLVVRPGHYKKGSRLLNEGRIAEAAIAFGKAGNYKDAREQSRLLWDQVAVRNTFDVDFETAVVLHEDGTVSAAGEVIGDVSDWDHCVAVANRSGNIFALRDDGTVYCSSDVLKENWKDIVSISVSYHYLGLKSDGTVVAAGVKIHGENRVGSWKNIVAIAAGGDHSVGLRADGTVVATGKNDRGQCDVDGWKDIVAIAAGYDHTVGLRSDGTVVATDYVVGSEEYRGQCDVSEWTDIVAISAGSYYTVGLRADGTVVSTPFTGSYALRDSFQERTEVQNWDDVIAVNAGTYDTLGLRADGSFVYAGTSYQVENSVYGWENVKTPYVSEEKQSQLDAAKKQKESVDALKKAMGRSLLEAIPLAEELSDVASAKTLLDICNTYKPYCGTYVLDTGVNVGSDFYWDGETVYWKCDPDVTVFGVVLDGELKTFFKEPLPVENMQSTEEISTLEATMKFENGNLRYTMGYYAAVQHDYSGKVVKKEDYTEVSNVLLTQKN